MTLAATRVASAAVKEATTQAEAKTIELVGEKADEIKDLMETQASDLAKVGEIGFAARFSATEASDKALQAQNTADELKEIAMKAAADIVNLTES